MYILNRNGSSEPARPWRYGIFVAVAAVMLLLYAWGWVAPDHDNIISAAINPTQQIVSETSMPHNIKDQSPKSAVPDLNDPATKLRAAKIISSFENSTTEIQYGYSEDLGDGRGITAGRSGFTSGTSDMLAVVELYATTKPNNALSKYIPALQKVDGTESTKGLSGLAEAWKREAKDPAFRNAQDQVTDELYFNPAMEWAKKENVHSALGQLILWDTITQHGEGDDPDGLPALIAEVNKTHPSESTEEMVWLGAFLKTRQKHLLHASDPETRQAWIESVDRVRALSGLLVTNNPTLKPPIRWSVYGDHFSLDT